MNTVCGCFPTKVRLNANLKNMKSMLGQDYIIYFLLFDL